MSDDMPCRGQQLTITLMINQPPDRFDQYHSNYIIDQLQQKAEQLTLVTY